MKVLLCYKNARELERIERTEIPVSLFWIGAALRKAGHEVLIENFSYLDWEEIPAFLEKEKPDLVAGAMEAINRWQIFKLGDLVKRYKYSVPFVVGGSFASQLPKEVLERSHDVDVVVTGPGESTMVSLAGLLSKKVTVADLEKVPGIAFKANNDALFGGGEDKIISTEIKTDDTKLPRPSSFFTYNKILTSRGCTSVKYREVDDIVAEVKELLDKGVQRFHFVDANCTSDKNRFLELCSKLPAINWRCDARIQDIDEELVAAMKKAGCYHVEYHVGSGHFMDGLSKEQVVKAASLLRKVGITQRAGFWIGYKEETDATIKDSLELIQDIQPQHIQLQFVRKFPGSKYFENSKDWFDSMVHLPFETIVGWEKRKDKLMTWMKVMSGFFTQNKASYQRKRSYVHCKMLIL